MARTLGLWSGCSSVGASESRCKSPCKVPDANWKVPWHQDVTIAVQNRIEADRIRALVHKGRRSSRPASCRGAGTDALPSSSPRYLWRRKWRTASDPRFSSLGSHCRGKDPSYPRGQPRARLRLGNWRCVFDATPPFASRILCVAFAGSSTGHSPRFRRCPTPPRVWANSQN